MDDVRTRREALGLTQGEAASKAGVSLATWRRLETDSESSFRRSTVDAVERVLRLPAGGLGPLRAGESVPQTEGPRPRASEWVSTIARSFTGDPLTPRQAYKLGMATAGMEDDAFGGWDDFLEGRCTAGDLWLVSELPDWVLFMVNTFWLQRFREVFVEIGRRVERGEVPYPRCVAERVALSIVLDAARETDDDVEQDMIKGNPANAAVLKHHGDVEDDWEEVEEALFDEDFDFKSIWLPNFTRAIFGDPTLLVERLGMDVGALHPFRWWETDLDLDEDPVQTPT